MKNNVFISERKRLNLTQAQLAKKLNTSRSNVANWENGFNMPSTDLLFKCSDLFGCDILYLAGYQRQRIADKDDFIPSEPEYDYQQVYDTLENMLKENGILPKGREFTKEDYDRLIQFIKANKDFIIKKDK